MLGILLTAVIISYPEYGNEINAYATQSFELQLENDRDNEESLNVILEDVPFISQLEDYPNGCEAVSSVMILRYYGFDIDVDRFIDEFLPMGERPVVNGTGPDPERVYCGDPRSKHGWGCYSPVIAEALEGFLGESGYTYVHSYNRTLDSLCLEYIDNGHPVMIWATVDMSESEGLYACWSTSEGKRICYNRKLHCLVLTGYDDEFYYFNDPMRGKNVRYEREKTQRAYRELGMQSIAVIKR